MDNLEMPRMPYDKRGANRSNRIKVVERYKWQKGKCFYCKKQMTIFDKPKDVVNYPDHLATLEHIYSRLDIRRAICRKTVVACYKCNNDKAKVENIIFNTFYETDFTEPPIILSYPGEIQILSLINN